MGTQEELETELSGHGVRPTAVRVIVCRCLQKASRPLSIADIDTELETVDRSTISRTMATLYEAGMLHRVDDGSGSMKYELCHDCEHCHDSGHSDLHAHFYCRRCGKTVCLTEVQVKAPELPEGFLAESASYVITGICPDCSRRQGN